MIFDNSIKTSKSDNWNWSKIRVFYTKLWFTKYKAIWTALVAAPFRILSATIHKLMVLPVSLVISSILQNRILHVDDNWVVAILRKHMAVFIRVNAQVWRVKLLFTFHGWERVVGLELVLSPGILVWCPVAGSRQWSPIRFREWAPWKWCLPKCWQRMKRSWLSTIQGGCFLIPNRYTSLWRI